MRKPSVKFKREMKRAMGEADFMGGIQRDIELAEAVRQGMESRFGAAMFNAFEEIERASYSGLATTSPFNFPKQFQLRAELATVQWVKSRLESYIVNAETLIQNMNELNGDMND
ncbi:hypothetical protein KAR91_69180 [Candidatus Pacearchaeota archaeon]|nr:hypothetical protein [Candidatus Pacearchaeota archaeon]